MNTNEFIPKQNAFLKKRKNNLLLSDYQIEVLIKNNIDYLSFSDYKNLIWAIENEINYNFDEELDQISKEISELYYYNFSNK